MADRLGRGPGASIATTSVTRHADKVTYKTRAPGRTESGPQVCIQNLLKSDAYAGRNQNERDRVVCMEMYRQPDIKATHSPYLHDMRHRAAPIVPNISGLVEALQQEFG